jgi:Fe-S-cluster containining protein
MPKNPCLSCGACCAFYRASFYWAECDDTTPGGVPVAMTEDFPGFRRAMGGTSQPKPRCVALEGEITREVYCSIYERRPSVCRDVPPSYQFGAPEEKCDKARIAYGLAPLTPESWHDTPENPDTDSTEDPHLPDDILRPAA